MKTIGFVKELVPLILSGKKTVTWRCFDHRNLTVGDNLLFIESESREPFARVKVVYVKKATFGSLTDEDKEGHEHYLDDEQMLTTFSRYYKTPITLDTELKIVGFELVD